MTAAEKGWWVEDLAPYGIKEVKDYEFPTGAPEMQAMMAGDLDVAYVGAAPVITALSQGLDAKIIAPVQIQGSNLVLRPEYEYNSPADLKGLKIATFPTGTIQDTLLREWLKQNGLDPEKDVTIIGMGPGDAITAISAKQVAAVFLPHPSPNHRKSRQRAFRCGIGRDAGKPCLLCAHSKWKNDPGTPRYRGTGCKDPY